MMTEAPPDADTSGTTVAAVVVCGGTSARMGGGDKTAMELGGLSVLDHLVGSLPEAWAVVCVGAERPLVRDVVWTREVPPQGGPVAGLAAGLARAADVAIVVALAGDQPFAGPAAAACATALVQRPDVDGVAARQADGRHQPLLAAYRRAPLAAAVSSAPPGSGVYRALSGLTLDGLDAASRATLDVDTPEDLRDARNRLASDRDATGLP